MIGLAMKTLLVVSSIGELALFMHFI